MKFFALLLGFALFSPVSFTGCTSSGYSSGGADAYRTPADRNAPKLTHARKKYITGGR